MIVVGLKVLKNRLSEYVRLAQQGETVLISDRDRVVAEIIPPQDRKHPLVADAVFADLVRQGHLTPALRPPSRPPQVPPIGRLVDLLQGLDEDRADR